MAIIGQLTLDQIAILEVDADPTSSGVPAPIGSIAAIYDGVNARLWVKSGAPDNGWTPMLRLATGATALQANTVMLTDASGNPTTNTTNMVWDPTNARLGIGLAAPAVPVSTLHVDRGTAQGAGIKFTAGTTTGQTTTDGLSLGIDGTGAGFITQYENAQFSLFTNNTRLMTLTPTQQVLVGAHTAPIDITGAGAFPLFQIIGTSAVQMASIQYSADTIAPVFNSLKSRGATLGTQGLVQLDDELGRFQFRGSDGTNFQAGAAIRALVDGTAASNSMPGRLIFMTTPTGQITPVERMRISQNGLVRVVDNLQSLKRVWDYQTAVSANTTTTLTATSAGIQYYTGTAANQIVRLPDATTLVVGQLYEIRNRNTVNVISVANNGGAVLDTTPAVTGVSVCHLLDNSNSNGTWDVRTRYEPYSNEATSAAGMSINSTTDVLITTMTLTPPAGTYSVSFEASVTVGTASSTLGFAVYAGGTINTDSNRSYKALAGANGAYAYTTGATVTVNGSEAIEIRGRRSTGTTTVNTRRMSITRVG